MSFVLHTLFMKMVASTDLFINLIQNHPIVYDKSLKDFKNVRKKDDVWADIAKESRMDAAKKRYFSLRQKYCREKRNMEVKRRNKIVYRNPWVFYDRLRFLDAFIQPRSTYTNDTGFVDDGDQDDMTEGIPSTDTFHEANAADSQNIFIELSENITADDINNLLQNNQNDVAAAQHANDAVDRQLVVQSEYTGETSEITYIVSEGAVDEVSLHSGEIGGGDSGDATTVQEHDPNRIVEEIDADYISPLPSTCASHTHSSNQAKQNFTADKTSSNFRKISTASIQHSITDTAPGYTNPSAKQPIQSRRETTAPINTTLRYNINASNNSNQQRQNASRPSSNKTTVNLNTNSIQTNAQPTLLSTHSSNEKSIEMIRNKMDSCLTAFQNKLTDKPQRSPHAPFLAYLGTKLVNVPKENMSELEEEILVIVKRYSK